MLYDHIGNNMGLFFKFSVYSGLVGEYNESGRVWQPGTWLAKSLEELDISLCFATVRWQYSTVCLVREVELRMQRYVFP